jgi:anti-sigma factor RsiW
MRDHPESELAAYATGDVADAERARIERHLVDCAACRTTVEEFQALLSELAATTPAPSDVAWPRYRAELRARRATRRISWRASWLRPLPLAASGAVAAAIAIVVYVALPGDRPHADLGAIEYDGLAGRIEMIDHYHVVEHLDLLEDLDVIRNLDRLAPTREG